MERRLLLLGLLKRKPMSGYRIGYLLEHQMGKTVNLTVSTAYRILASMCAEGLIEGREERDGKRPPKTVYSITERGIEAFDSLLRSCLSNYGDVSYQNAVPLGFLDQLPLPDAILLLEERLTKIQKLKGFMSAHQSHHGAFSIVLEHHFHHLQTEADWLNNLIIKLKKDL